jgi:hypothetical protein
MIFPVVIPMNIDIDVMIDVRFISGCPKDIVEKSIQSFLESAEFSHGLWMMHARRDVFFNDVGLAVFSDGLVLPVELGSVVCEKV